MQLDVMGRLSRWTRIPAPYLTSNFWSVEFLSSTWIFGQTLVIWTGRSTVSVQTYIILEILIEILLNFSFKVFSLCSYFLKALYCMQLRMEDGNKVGGKTIYFVAKLKHSLLWSSSPISRDLVPWVSVWRQRCWQHWQQEWIWQSGKLSNSGIGCW